MRILHMAAKDLLLLWRDKFGMFWILAFPLTFALFFGSIFGSGGGSGAGSISLIVIDQDQTEASTALIEKLGESDAVRFMNRSDKLPWTPETARETVRKGRSVAYLIVPQGYGSEGGFMFGPGSSELEVGIDPGRTAEKGFLQGLLMEAAFARMQDMFTNPTSMQPDVRNLLADINSDVEIPTDQREVLSGFFESLDTFLGDVDFDTIPAGDAPSFEPVTLNFREVTPDNSGEPRNAFEISFPQAVAWGIMGCAAGFAISLVQERTAGTYLRLRVAPNRGPAFLRARAWPVSSPVCR